MMPDVDTITGAAGGTAALLAVTMILRRVWRQISAETVETKRDGAEGTLLTNLRTEIERMGCDIARIKAVHEADIARLNAQHEIERQELMRQINELRERLDQFGSRFTAIRLHAMDAYSVVATGCRCDDPCREKIKDHLHRIIKEGEQ